MAISLRPARDTDCNFLWNLHQATMKNYVDRIWGWDEAFQKAYFTDRFSIKNMHIIEQDETAVGVVKFRNQTDALYLENIEVDPLVQNKGIGSLVLKTIIEKATSQCKPVKLQVLKVNPARQLYERLNFEVVSETQTHFLMMREAEL